MSRRPSYLVKAFREAGHVADTASRRARRLRSGAVDEAYDVLIVDRMLPKMDGISLIGGLRAQKIKTPVLILSALGQVDDRVKGLRAGRRRLSAQALCLFRTARARRESLARRKQPGTGEDYGLSRRRRSNSTVWPTS